MKQRDEYVDIAKGLCMLLIICIHTEVFGVIGMPLTFIAVPMFFFMSGFYDRSERAWKEWLPKTAKGLLLPAMIWLTIGRCYLTLLGYIKTGAWDFGEFNIVEPCFGNGPVWFLIALLYTKVVVGLLERLPMNKYVIGAIALGIGYLGSSTQMPALLDEGLAAVPLYYAGKQLYPYIGRMIDSWIVMAIGGGVLLVFVSTPLYYNIGPGNDLYSPCYIVAIAAAFPVFLGILALSKKLKRVRVLETYGQHTLGIMLVHAPMCHTCAVILNRVFEKGSTEWIACFLIAYVFIVIVSYGLSRLVERYVPILFGR